MEENKEPRFEIKKIRLTFIERGNAKEKSLILSLKNQVPNRKNVILKLNILLTFWKYKVFGEQNQKSLTSIIAQYARLKSFLMESRIKHMTKMLIKILGKLQIIISFFFL